MSDRIAVMLDGHIEQLADPDTIYDQPASAFVAGFIGQNNFLPGTATGECERPRRRRLRRAGGPAAARPARAGAAGAGRCASRVGHAPSPRIPVPWRTRCPARWPACRTSATSCSTSCGAATSASCSPASRADRARRLAPGADVWCTWSPDDVRLFSAAQTAAGARRPRRRMIRRPSRTPHRTPPNAVHRRQ